jgi:hypothetical protein
LLDKDISTIVALGRLPALLSLFVLAAAIDRMNAPRTYGMGNMLVGVCVIVMGLIPDGGVEPVIATFMIYFLIQGSVWGSGPAAVNTSVEPELRDSAFALTSILLSIALFGVGFVHNRLLSARLSVAQVFSVSGLIPIAGGSILVVYSFLRQRKAPVKTIDPLVIADERE